MCLGCIRSYRSLSLIYIASSGQDGREEAAERKWSISPGAWEWKQRSICWDLKSQSMNNLKRCFFSLSLSLFLGRLEVQQSCAGRTGFPKVPGCSQKYLQCQEVFSKIFEKIRYRADLSLGIWCLSRTLHLSLVLAAASETVWHTTTDCFINYAMYRFQIYTDVF